MQQCEISQLKTFFPCVCSTSVGSKASSPVQTRAWEDCRREARQIESDLEAKISAFAKFCSGYEGSYRSKGETGLATDQLAHSKAIEIEDLLGRLSDVNDSLSSSLSGAADSRSHTLARHRDILHDYTQEFRRLQLALGAARDRADLLAGTSDSSPLQVSIQIATGLLLRERGNLQNTHSAMDDVLGQAQAVAGGLGEQRRIFDNVGLKLENVVARFPLVSGLLSAIRRKKNKDTIILSAVVIACSLALLLYWWNK
ncbi:Qb-snare protein, Gos1/GS28-family [Coccomyxa subellipsoidea C-169]|uniref:Qb-snare protein, Gos1/GS28-family n=1 Tax=Coccomyxa subellipsoidea (strain C-169) TaxID=574566 RepID=I0Z0W3_COCSC|nr:Qb-snare protein, Gos1/GS28-family [Coccomyxa subellipsoidea C-169]EIE24282.1 Qb-snare protein, Gos1/GS28-family [Coccomyxa subellipsoidea C-169]|eukprot:XP_005648826.1 Qb-snare protein, Gos1/GS28-family [Coccomyxa subellipsoidea C-169]